MFPTAAMLYLYVESPLHAGVGRREDAAADLPIQREEATGFPVIQASTIKGTLRRLATGVAKAEDVVCAFGPEPEALRDEEQEAEERFAGALVLADARLLLFPVRSLLGVFAWITSAEILARFQRDATAYGLSPGLLPVPAPPDGTAWVAPNSRVITERSQLVLEEVTFQARVQQEIAVVGHWLADTVFPQGEAFSYWREKVKTDIVVLPEDAFRFFVVEATEIVYRIRLDPQTGVALEGALWTEEYLPSDTVLYVPIGAQAPAEPSDGLKSAKDVLTWFKNLGSERIQVGGSRTLGRGILHLHWGEEVNG